MIKNIDSLMKTELLFNLKIRTLTQTVFSLFLKSLRFFICLCFFGSIFDMAPPSQY